MHNERFAEEKVERPVIRTWTSKKREQPVRNCGRWICFTGAIWFVASLAAFWILLGFENAGFVFFIDGLAGAVMYFGMYFWSWLLIVVGGLTWFVGAVIRR